MSYDVIIRPGDELSAVHKWIKEQGWKHIVEWRWFIKRNQVGSYTFQFESEEHAILFTLRWS